MAQDRLPSVTPAYSPSPPPALRHPRESGGPGHHCVERALDARLRGHDDLVVHPIRGQLLRGLGGNRTVYTQFYWTKKLDRIEERVGSTLFGKARRTRMWDGCGRQDLYWDKAGRQYREDRTIDGAIHTTQRELG